MQFPRFTGPEITSRKEHPILDIPHELWDGKRIISGGAMLIGYARVSTLDQNLNLQPDALTMAGLQAARARGRKGGRRCKLTDDQAKLAANMLDDPTNKVKDIIVAFHVPRSTPHRAAQPYRKHPSTQEHAHAQ